MPPPSARHVVLFRTALEAWDATPHTPADAPETRAPGRHRSRVMARVMRAGALPQTHTTDWTMPQFAGRLAELSGAGSAARLSLAGGLVRDAQGRREPAAWIGLVGGSFYPPDAAASGIDLEALPVIATPDVAAALRVAIHLARSGAFGLLILDLVSPPPVDHHGRAGVRRLPRTSGAADRQRAAQQLPTASFTKLAGLAQQHGVAVVFLTDALPEQPSLGSLISLRCDTQRQAAGEGRFLCVATALKDKRRGPGWSFAEVQLGPLGLR